MLKVYTKEELQEILEKHKEYFKSGNVLLRANLSKANLSGANLSEANLFGANLSEANLYGANLSKANLFGANLSFTLVKGFYVGQHFGYKFGNKVKIGCIEMTLKEWIKKYKQVGKENDYSKQDIANYGIMLRALAKMK